ncbi:hypothetical protein D6C90_03886 [Aureobasidium pullulans]|uniref:Uncharacterized protein n=1 Tax=Aureobasidium pullulans TaxID=5580 RepID=A0A4S9VA79_AURPU|nr:hypothetical protein D6C90_03886 [Aureobasidium pullulans]
MTAHAEPLAHHDEVDDYSDDCVSTDGFTPSLPTLTNRAPEADTDAQSVSDVDSISNGDTVSDASDADYDEICYDEIPALATRARARLQEAEPSEEDMEHVMMSDRTIIPDTPTMAQRMPQLSSERTIHPAMAHEDARLIGMSLAEKPYQLPDRPLRLLYIGGDSTVTNMDVACLMSKIIGAMTGRLADKEAFMDAASQVEPHGATLSSSNDSSIPVTVMRAAVIAAGPAVGPLIFLHDNSEVELDVTKPDLVVFHRQDCDDVYVELAQKLALHNIPMLEVEDESEDPIMSDVDSSCIIPQTAQGEHCLRLSIVSSSGGESQKTSNKEVALSHSAFYALDDDVLSRHLAFLANRSNEALDKEAIVPTKKGKKFKLSSLLGEFPFALSTMQSVFTLLMILFAAGVPTYFLQQQQNAASDLATRAPLLQAALNKSGLGSINASDVLRYPTVTSIVANTTSTAVAFPTAVNVHVAKSDQLLVSLPKSYWNSAQIGLFRNGKALSNVNNTRVIDGVLSVSLPTTDAHGQIQISVLSTNAPLRNETIKIDLGNRLLQRVTYENAAKGVQQDVTEVHHAAKLAQAKVISDVHSVFNTSVYCVKSLGGNIRSGVKSTGNIIGSASNRTSHGLSYMGGLTYNKTSALGSFVKSTVPQKRLFVRARNNALKIRTRLLRGPSTSEKNVGKPRGPSTSEINFGKPKSGGLSLKAMSLTDRIASLTKLRQQLSSNLDALLKKAYLHEQRSKTTTSSKVKVTVKTVVQPKSKAPSSNADPVKGSKSPKQLKLADEKLNSPRV